MPDAKNLEAAARHVVPLALAELSISSSMSPPRSNLPALVRRCIQLLPHLISGDANLFFRCCQGLLASLGAILSREPSPSLLPAIEVIAESLVSSEQLMSCLVKANYSAPEGSMMFTEARPLEDEHIMLELVCCHFISSLLDEGAFEVFLSALSRPGRALQPTLEISFQGVLVLVQKTWFLSLPAVVQAHLLLLMTRCTSVQNLNLHMQAFEYAMKLYVRYLPALSVFNRIVGAKGPLIYLGKKIPFSCVKDTTEQKLRSQIDGLLLFCQSNSGDDLPIDDSDIDRVIEENQHMFHEKFRRQCTVIVKAILSGINVKQKEVLESDAEVSGEIICLAAALRVMASSFPHILHHFSQMESATDNEYNDIYEIISLLGQHETNVLHRYVPAVTGKPVANESASMLMLDHFASLSACCLRWRLGFLWKGCITMMMMATNLIAEEQSLSKFHLPMDASEDSSVSSNTTVAISEVSARTKKIILRYKSIHRFRNNGRHIYGDGISLGTPDEECNSRVGNANGQRFLECLPKYSRKGWADILDFVDCEEGKDYSNVLEQRQKFKKFKDEKFLNQKQCIRQSTIEFLGVKSRRKRQQSTIEFSGVKSRSKSRRDH